MKFSLKPLLLALLLAASEFAAAAGATPATAAQADQAAQLHANAPDDWIVYGDTLYTPVVDALSRHLDAARKAFDARDSQTAAKEMRAVGEELKSQAARADREDQSLIKEDQALMAADTKGRKETVRRLSAIAQKADAAAAAVDSGKINSKADLDKVINRAARADMDRRWLVSDVTTWYPVTEEPQRHFTDAAADYAAKEYKAAAADVRKAVAYLRLEAARASGDPKRELRSSVTELDRLAATLDKGAVKDEKKMDMDFAKANHALALEHRAKAAESWARKDYDQVGYDLKAAAHGLESSARWLGGEASAGAADTVADTRVLGDKLASGATWTREELSKGFESLGEGINALGQRIGGTRVAAKFHLENGA